MELPTLTPKPTDTLLPSLPGLLGLEGDGLSDSLKEEEAAMIAVAEGIQPLARKIIRKVDSKEYVDFSDLLQDQLPQEDLGLPSHSGVVLVQSLESLRRKKMKISDFQSWVEALLVYVATRCRTSQPEIANLLAYGVIMSQTARDHPPDRWLSYDRKFREMAGARKELCWNEINTGLWNRCLTGQGRGSGVKVCNICMASGHVAWECQSNGPRKIGPKKRPLAPQRHTHQEVCYPFNNKGACDRVGQCQFAHRCINCGEDHPQIHCTARTKRRPE